MYHEGLRIREVLSVKTGAIGTMVSCHCVLCYHDKKPVLQAVLLWFGVESYTPLVCAFPGVVVEKGMIQLHKDREV